MHGIISGFPVRKPTPEELRDCEHVELTSDLEWDPMSTSFAEKEEVAMTKTVQVAVVGQTSFDHVDDGPIQDGDRYISALSTLDGTRSLVETVDDDDFACRLISQVRVASDDIEGDGLSGHGDPEVYPLDSSTRSLFALSTDEKCSIITPEVLSRRWNIGLAVAKRTLNVTTQVGIRNVLVPAERRTRQRFNYLKFPTLRADIYSDTMFAESKKASLQGCLAAQVFTNGKGYDRFYPLKTKGLAHEALTKFIQDCGIPKTMITDKAREELDGKWGKICQMNRIQQKVVAPYSQWQNRAEALIWEIKKSIQRLIRKTHAPRRLWCYAGQWVTAICRLTALDLPSLDGRVPDESVTGNTPDISEYAQFDWYKNVWYMEYDNKFPHDKKTLGKWLGVATNCTEHMTFFILGPKGKVVMRPDVWALTRDEMGDPAIKEDICALDTAIKLRIGDSIPDTDVDPDLIGTDPNVPEGLFKDMDDEMDVPFEPNHPSTPDDFTLEAYDEYLTAEVLLPEGGEMKKARVIGRKRDADGLPIGTQNSNPILDTREYVVEYPDGLTDAVTANIIAENMYAQVDSEGRMYAVMDEITDHRKNGHALAKDDGFFIDRSGRRQNRITTKGWELQVKWRDGSTSWVALKDLKESNPVEVAEYAVANKISKEPAFLWWIRDVLRRRDRIIKKVKSRYWAKTHKFGIELPKSVKHALEINARTGTDVWMQKQQKPNGDKYWEYVLVYVDDILVISHDPKAVMGYLSLKYTLKEGSVKEPDTYLGADIRKWTIDEATDATKTRWAMSLDTYVKRAVADVERELEQVGKRLLKRVTTPMASGYRPELDVSAELDARRANYFQGLIGILRWICELGRIDIIVPVAMLSRFLAAPRLGHLEQCFHIFAYLKQHDRSSVVFDDQESVFDERLFKTADWADTYPGAKEEVPPNAPELRGETVKMSCFVDADHAGCRATRRSHSGVLIFINRAPIIWFSKQQNTVESSTFGSEFIAMKQAVDLVEGLRYKLRMMGIEVDGPTSLFCDNEAVVCNSTKPESTLKKKHNAIAYHRVREALAAKIVRVAKESGLTNLADGLTKCLPGPRLKEIFSAILW